MVLLAGTIISKSGKVIVDGLFGYLPPNRLEELFEAFLNKVNSEKQKTTADVLYMNNLRFVYQPFETVYALIVTYRQDDINDDMHRLSLLSQVVQEFYRPGDEYGPCKLFSEISSAFVRVMSVVHSQAITIDDVKQHVKKYHRPLAAVSTLPSAIKSRSCAPPLTDPITVMIEENVKATLERDGLKCNFEVHGTLSLHLIHWKAGLIQLQIDSGDNPDIEYEMHPIIDKKWFLSDKVLLADNPYVPLPAVGSPFGDGIDHLLSWRLQSEDMSVLPLKRKNGGRKRNRFEDKKRQHIPSSPSDSGTSSEEHSEEHADLASEDEQEEEVAVYKEPSMYDNLLKTLGSASESIADAYKRRQRAEEGKSDTDEDEEDEDDDLELLSGSDEDEDEAEEGDLDPTDVEDASLAGMEEHSEDDAEESSDTDGEEYTENTSSIANESESSSSFSAHLDYKLLKEEIESLSTNKVKYKWEVDAVNYKWVATKEPQLEDSYTSPPYGLNQKLYDHWLNTYKPSGGQDLHSSRQRSFFSLCNSYRDILHHNKKPFYLKGREEDSSIMDGYLLHSLNHVFKTRDIVTKNEKKLAKENESKTEGILAGESFLDQGFTRPKVLILLPFASIAFRVVKRLIELTPSGNRATVDHFGRFSDEYGTGRADDQDGEDDMAKTGNTSKPSDFQFLFGGNNNDHFIVGIKFTKKTIKLYSDFYTSDMIVASPLGLITKIGEAEADKEKDVDYLSSIEVLIVDHADVIAMQNWAHVNTVVGQLNRIPSKQHGTDIMRIRPWYLDGQARFYRQTIILGSHVNPDINYVFNKHCLNHKGRVKLLCEHKGVLPKVLLQVRQIYNRIDTESIMDADDARLDYFKNKVYPKLKDSGQGGIMIFISSYFDFVRVRNFLKSEDASMCLFGEDTKNSDISRARNWFFQGKRKIMLYTERAHFYYRYKIRGIQNLIIYSLPERKEFYPQIVNMLEGSNSMNCTVLFSRFDLLRLERIVGTAPAKRMVTSDKRIFTFC